LGTSESLGERVSVCYKAIGTSGLSPDLLGSILSTGNLSPPEVDIASEITSRRNLIGSNIKLFYPLSGPVENELSFVEIMLRVRLKAGAHPFDDNAESTQSKLELELGKLAKFRKFGMELLDDWEMHPGQRFVQRDFNPPVPFMIPDRADDENFRLEFGYEYGEGSPELELAGWLLGSTKYPVVISTDLIVSTPDISRRHELAAWEFRNLGTYSTPFRSTYSRAVDFEKGHYTTRGDLVEIAIGDERTLELLNREGVELWSIVELCMDHCKIEDVIDLLLGLQGLDDYTKRMEIIKMAQRWVDSKVKMHKDEDDPQHYKLVARQWLTALGLVGA